MQKLPPDEYYKSLATKRLASGVLFFNAADEMLIVKPNYKDGWSIPGGVVDKDESPKSAAIRETLEEIGLLVQDIDLLCVTYTKGAGVKTEAIQFIFSGGVLTEEQISKINLQKDELDAHKFIPTEQAIPMLIPGLRERAAECLVALKNKTVIYRES